MLNNKSCGADSFRTPKESLGNERNKKATDSLRPLAYLCSVAITDYKPGGALNYDNEQWGRT